MTKWINRAVEFLLARGTLPVLYWLKRDILEISYEREQRNLRKYALRVRLLESQRPDGSWCERVAEKEDARTRARAIIDTLKNLFHLYDYGCTLRDEGIARATEFLFSTQTKEGDFRGAYYDEYVPTFHALTLEILCRFGLDRDRRVQRGFRWIVDHRQADGGWVIPYQVHNRQRWEKTHRPSTPPSFKAVQFDPSLPSSLRVTGIMLRPLAESPTWRTSKVARQAADWLAEKLLEPDCYEENPYRETWSELHYPFWTTDVLSVLDVLSRFRMTSDHPKIQGALECLLRKQNSHGFWECSNNEASFEDHLWVTLSVLRVMKRFGFIQS